MSGRVAIVTGAASGIGRAAVERLVTEGGRVVAVDIDADQLTWVDEYGRDDHLASLVGDVSSEETNAEAVALALDRFGRLDASVLNAGVATSGGLLDLPMEAFERGMAINVRGVALGIRAATPAMRSGGGGRIVATASPSGIAADPGLWAYNTAKGAVVNLVRAAALELGIDGITVNAVCPGPTETQMTANLRSMPELYDEIKRAIPLQRAGRPEEIAAVIAFLASADASFVNGAIVPVDGGITANTGQFRPRATRSD